MTPTYSVDVYSTEGAYLPQMGEPVMLDAGYNTTLKLYMNSFNSSEYVVYGRLYESRNDTGFGGQPVKIYLNDTLVATAFTDENGDFNWMRNFDPGNTSVTYMVQAVYEGEGNQTAVLNGTSFDGKPYTRCTSLYCTHKPAANITQLIIKPETLEERALTKTPERMQQEAVENGGMAIRHWFNWCYPWYRTYIVFCTGVSPLNQWEMGFNPLLPDEGSASDIDEIWDFFAGIIEEFGYDFAMGLLKIAGARILTYLGERPFLTLPNVQAIIFGIGCATSLFLLYTDWNNKAALYGGALGAFLVMAITGAPKFGPVFIGLLSYIIGNPCFETIGKILWAIQEIVTNMIKALFRSLIDVAEVLFGAALIITALWRASAL